MTTSLSPPDVDTTIRLHTDFNMTHPEGTWRDLRLCATPLSKGQVQHTQNWTSLLPIEDVQSQRGFANNPYFHRPSNPIHPPTVVNPKDLTDSLDLNSSPKTCGLGGLPSLTGLESEALSISVRPSEPSTACAETTYFPQETSDSFSHVTRSAENEAFISNTTHAKNVNPLLTTTGMPIYKYGNDTSFIKTGFHPPLHHKSEEEITQSTMNLLGCLEPQESYVNTRISSPRLHQQVHRSGIHLAISDMDHLVSSGSVSANSSEAKKKIVGVRPKNRRKTNSKDQKSFHPKQVCGQNQPRQKKLMSCKDAPYSQEGLVEKAGSSSGSRQSGILLSSRQNLSSEQRRANHIGSEKQRRDSIQALEEELRRIVPVLRNGDYSKAEMLEQAGNWLEDLIRGNRILKARLKENRS
jgi:hypothetical protein